MPRWFDSAAHGDPHRPVPLGRTALTCVIVYTVGAVIGWGVVAALVVAAMS